jgi:cell division septal protein FtsQ
MSRRRTSNTRMTSARQRKRQFFADVNARGGRERWQKTGKFCGLFLRFTLATALLCGVYFGVTKGWRALFWKNSDYSLRAVLITKEGGGVALTNEQIFAASGIALGQNILSYSLPDIQKAVAQLPQVQKVKVLRSLPNRMEIRVEERRPVAWITTRKEDDHLTSESSYLVDADANWFRPKEVLHEYKILPVIYGVVTDDLQAGQVIRNAEILATLDLIQKNTKAAKFQARSFDVTKGYCIVARDQNGTQMTFALDDIERQFESLDKARQLEQNFSQQISTVNLMLTRNIPITWVPPQPPEETEFPPRPVEVAKPTTKDLKARQAKKPEPKKIEPKKEPKRPNPDQGLYKPFLRA